jgi:cysteine-rich repeat protein
MATWARIAYAHRAPIPIAFWGDFDPTTAHCQRMIGAAAARCGLTVWKVRQACLAAQLSGDTCDVNAADAAVAQAHVDALDMADRACADTDLSALNFSLTLDVNADIDTFCQQLETAVVSAVYSPVLRAGGIGAADPKTPVCIRVTTRATTTLLHFSFGIVRRIMDHVAHSKLTPTQKQTLISQAKARIGRARERLETRITAACPDTTFAAMYQRNATALLGNIATRADCLAGAAYVQDAMLCPPPLCGNGMVEPREQCDDGNLADGDGCHSDCTTEPAS